MKDNNQEKEKSDGREDGQKKEVEADNHSPIFIVLPPSPDQKKYDNWETYPFDGITGGASSINGKRDWKTYPYDGME